MTVGSSTTLNVSMRTDVTELVEVVVTGYASQQKRDITGSVAVVDIKDMTKIASSNFGDQLQGKEQFFCAQRCKRVNKDFYQG